MIDPRNADLLKLLNDAAECKAKATCPRLEIRELYFEPTPWTLDTWRADHGFYSAGIDPRLVFVCENPSDRKARDLAGDFEINGQRGWICWN